MQQNLENMLLLESSGGVLWGCQAKANWSIQTKVSFSRVLPKGCTRRPKSGETVYYEGHWGGCHIRNLYYL